MPKTSRSLTVDPPTLREVEDVRVADLNPGMRRVTLAGAQLREVTTANGLASNDVRRTPSAGELTSTSSSERTSDAP